MPWNAIWPVVVRIMTVLPLALVVAHALRDTRPTVPWMFCWIGAFALLNLGAVAWRATRRACISRGKVFPLEVPLVRLKIATLTTLGLYGVVTTFAAAGHVPNWRKSFIQADSGPVLAIVFLAVMAASVAAYVPYVLARRKLVFELTPTDGWIVVEGTVTRRDVRSITVKLDDGGEIGVTIKDAPLFGMTAHADDYDGDNTRGWRALVAGNSAAWVAQRDPRATLRRELWREVGFVAQLAIGWILAVVAVIVTG